MKMQILSCPDDYGTYKYGYCVFSDVLILLNIAILILLIYQLVIYVKYRSISYKDLRTIILILGIIASFNNILQYGIYTLAIGRINILFLYILNIVLYQLELYYFIKKACAFVK